MGGKKQKMEENIEHILEMLERQIENLQADINKRFDRIDASLDKYASKESFNLLKLMVIGIFFVMLFLHGFADVIKGIGGILQ